VTRAQEAFDAQIRDASTVNSQRSESRRRPLPRSASMTDDKPGPGLAELTVTADDVLAPMLAGTAGVHAEVDAPRHYRRGRAAGVDWDVEMGAARQAQPSDDPAEGEESLDVSGDERLAPGGAAEQEFSRTSARHRAGTWPRGDAVVVDLRDIREGRYRPAS
jgi:hypothetical protein